MSKLIKKRPRRRWEAPGPLLPYGSGRNQIQRAVQNIPCAQSGI